MKDKYFGDFGDYQKFTLLKHFRDVAGLRITVHWMRTKDDLSKDGNKISYLKKPQIWATYDPAIFWFLKNRVDTRDRKLKHFETSNYGAGMQFINKHIENLSHRERLLEETIKERDQSDLIFFDPDNGIEVKTTTKSKLHKYVLWKDISAVYHSGKSVLIYQHFSRKNRDDFIKDKVDSAYEYTSIKPIAIRVQHSVYFLFPQKVHETKLKKGLDSYTKVWGSLVKIENIPNQF